MQLSFDTISFAVGNSTACTEPASALPIFSEEILSFLEAVSKKLLKNCKAKHHSDVITFAFWCRRASLEQMKKKYASEDLRVGRGVVFHIAPSNVAVNFAYSLVAGLLAGNRNIVRLPSNTFEQVDIICDAINEVLHDRFSKLLPYVCLVRYAHDKAINDYFSAICDTRIIWGGDQTIMTLRNSPLKIRANEITLADRFSLALLNADEYLKGSEKDKIAQHYYNDTYLTDQNACTSPCIVIWTGVEVERAREVFWNRLYNLIKERYSFKPVQAVDKLTAMYLLAESKHAVCLEPQVDNYLLRMKLKKLDEDVIRFKSHSGFFMEYCAKCLDEILPICTERCQTLSYYGFSKVELQQFVEKYRPSGIDRIVPLGKTMDFSLVWDGYDFIVTMSKQIRIV